MPTATLTRRWLRIEVRRRWRSLALLALLVAVGGGTTMAAVAGARRAASALERLQDRARPATAVVFANSPDVDWGRIAALPEVDSLTTFVQRYAFYFDGVSHRIGLAGHSVATPLSGAFAPADDALFTTIERPVVIKGRLFDPSRDDEVVVTPGFVAHVGKGVGDTLTLTLPSPAEVRAGLDGTSAKLSGPRITMHIVGVARSPWFSDSADSPGGAVLSPGLIAQHRENTIGSPRAIANPAWLNALVRLRHNGADLARFRNALVAATHRPDLQVWNLPQQRAQEQHEIAFEARCLLAFAGAVLIAALLVLAQAAARYTAVSVEELDALRGPGITRGQQVVLAAVGPALAAVPASIVGAGAAVLASHWFPIATAGYVEPHPGLVLDWVVIGPGTVVFVGAAAAAAAGSAWHAGRRQVASGPARRSALVTSIARRGLPVPVVIGTGFALEPGPSRTAQPVRLTLVTAVAGVLGIVAALTFAGGVRDASARPERYGQTWQRGGFIGADGHDYYPATEIARFLAKSPDVTGVGDIRESNASNAAGQGSVSLFAMASSQKPLHVIVTSGRLPEARDEVLLAPRTLAALDLRVGSRVMFTGDNGSARYRVTGVGFVPQGDPSHVYSDGGWLTTRGYGRIFAGFQFHFMAIRIADGRSPGRVAAALSDRISATFDIPKAQALTFDAAAPPIQILQLRQVRTLPIVLGVFLALLAVAAISHALATAVRRRAPELAVLRALGMTPAQCRIALITQATVTAVVGLALGIPLGIAVGRSVWRAVAGYTPLEYVQPAVTWPVLICAPAALVLAALLATLPGNRAARLPVAQVLRAE